MCRTRVAARTGFVHGQLASLRRDTIGRARMALLVAFTWLRRMKVACSQFTEAQGRVAHATVFATRDAKDGER
jgi:hypothetical protein